MQIHRAVGIQAQAAAVGQREILTLAAPGVQVRQQRVTQRAARAQPQTAAEQAQAGDHTQRITSRTVGLQQQLARFAGLPGHASIQGAHRVEGPTESLLQFCPGLGMRGIHRQPGVEPRLQRGVRLAGAQAHHPVNGLLADGVQLWSAHGAISLR
ncbi:hypothetical protein D3C85_1036420 [compost metagenome]